MRRVIVFIVLAAFAAVICTSSCRHKQAVAPVTGAFPDSIANILLTQCTNAGCHNAASYQNADGLLLDSWQHLFQGGASGAEVVAYNTELSPLLYFCNAYDSADQMQTDPGHLVTPPTLSQYLTLKRWIAAGAPDANGDIPFASNPDTRQKIYLTISGCNLIAVIDGQSRVVIRYIPVGSATSTSIHDVRTSHDGMYAYTSMFEGAMVQKIDTRTDTIIATTNLAPISIDNYGGWAIILVAPADTALMVSGWVPYGSAVMINTSTMAINENLSLDISTMGITSLLPSPHGLACNRTFDTFYACLNTSNTLAKFWVGTNGKLSVPIYISLSTNAATATNPHEIQMSPDYSKYFVTCQNTSEVRVLDRQNDSVIKVIPVGDEPQEMAISTSKNYLFVTCINDGSNPTPGSLGSVYVIDINTLEIVTILYGDFYQPHGVTVDEIDGLVYICSENQAGPAPHHVIGNCSGNDGWYTVYNLNTLTMYNYRYQVPVFPYVISSRFDDITPVP